MEAKSTFWQRLTRGARRLHAEPRWEELLGANWPERIMGLAVTDRLHAKQGRSIGRLIVQKGGRRLAVYLKRHYRLPWWSRLLALLFPKSNQSPALQEWVHLAWASAQQFPVPAAVAAGEYVGPWGGLQSFLAVEELAGQLPLHEAIPLAARRLDSVRFARWKQGLVAEMARLVRALHARRRFHRDLYLCHFYIREEDTRRAPETWHDCVSLIDFHRLAHRAWGWRFWQMKDLGQLLYSSDVEGVTPRDRLRFWSSYREGHAATWIERGVSWIARWKAASYRRHNLKRRKRTGLPAPTPALCPPARLG